MRGFTGETRPIHRVKGRRDVHRNRAKPPSGKILNGPHATFFALLCALAIGDLILLPLARTGFSSAFVVCCTCASSSKSLLSVIISCMVTPENSLNESSCWRTRPFSAKYALMTSQHDSCHSSSRVM